MGCERHNRFTPAQKRRFADRARNESLTEEMVLISQQKTTPGHSQRKSSWTEKLNYRGQLKRSPSLISERVRTHQVQKRDVKVKMRSARPASKSPLHTRILRKREKKNDSERKSRDKTPRKFLNGLRAAHVQSQELGGRTRPRNRPIGDLSVEEYLRAVRLKDQADNLELRVSL